jgi:acetylornithine deacetylase/succinyl-diaminopimelate desuccinylase-like protein
MSFWTDAAILAGAGIPSVLGPGGAGLHSHEEYVNVDDVHLSAGAGRRRANSRMAGACCD